MGRFLRFVAGLIFLRRRFLAVAFALFFQGLSCYSLVFVVFICFLINSSMSFFRINSKGWKSLSILSTRIISSRFTNLLNSVRRALDIFFIFSRSFFISRLSFFISLSSSSMSCREEIRFLPRSRTRSLISRFRSSMSLRRVLKSDRRNWVWSWGCGSAMMIIS